MKINLKSVYLSFYLKTLGKEEQIKSKSGRMKEVIQIRMEVNEKGNRKTTDKINQKLVLWKDQQNWQNFSYIDWKKRRKLMINIRNEKDV